MKNLSDSLDEILEKLDAIKSILEKDKEPNMWEHSCPAMGTELILTEDGHECNWCRRIG